MTPVVCNSVLLYRKILAAVTGSLVLSLCAFAQGSRPAKPSPTPDDVIRVETNLAQTDVLVVDKKGQVVTGLRPSEFELRVDERPQAITAFDEVISGSSTEGKRLYAARGLQDIATPPSAEKPEQRRRPFIFFFVDDIHLSGEGMARTRSLLLDFLNNQMRPNDRVAIVSTSGQIGFLQQLTDNKSVLREAIGRLSPRYDPEAMPATHVTLTEVDANMVANHSDSGLFEYLVAATMKEYQMQNPLNAIMMVNNRVNQINKQGKIAEFLTLTSLESLIRSTTPLPGRKVVFFISDGFVVDLKRSNGATILQRVAARSAAVGAVIYALDTRANSFGPAADVSRNDYPDFTPATAWRSLIENKAPQEPLEALADQTGGRAYLNASGLTDGVSDALAENASYYLLGWRPNAKQRASRANIEVRVTGRPDLRVRARRRYFDVSHSQPTSVQAPSASSPEDQLKLALASLYPRRDVTTEVSVVVTSEKESALEVSMRIDGSMLAFESDGKQPAIVDVLGAAIDYRGVCSTFKQKLDVPRDIAVRDRFVQWKRVLPLPPGLYQVRVAVRDRTSGRVGSAMTWIEIPKREVAPQRNQ
jgi:VWFA-related protein